MALFVPLTHNGVFSLFNAEEMGLLGSEHFASSWESFKAEYGAISAMFNFDMVGRFQQEISVMGVLLRRLCEP